jgi:catechol 2,3-dioxygenase-like lactoylglutathione lyase family enzyme
MGREPTTMIRTQRISHPAFFGIHREETIRFYRDLLGMELVLSQPNLDNAEMDHFFFHVGSDNFIAYFLPVPGSDTSKYHEHRHGSGGMQHLAMDVDEASFAEAQERLKEAGIRFSGPTDRGYERSIYFRDPNGVLLELLVWKVAPLDGVPQAELIRRAQEKRHARGAGFVDVEDLQAVVDELGREQG